MDIHLVERATAAGQAIRGLETIEQQVALFDDLDGEAQEAFLRYTIRTVDRSVALLDEISVLWQRGEADAIAAALLACAGDQPALLEQLFYRRNRSWIPQIEALLASRERAVVVVGMGHLVGPGSVIDLLRQRGHDVTQVQAAAGTGATHITAVRNQ